MPFASHRDFHAPPNSNATIWRYMDLAKFLSLLDRSALYFPRVDKLAAADAYEGYYTDVSGRVASMKYEDVPEQFWREWKIEDEGTRRGLMLAIQESGKIARATRETSYVNSWHVLEHESAAMWALYLKSQDGIAVQSSYANLIDAMSGYKEFDVFAGMMNYIDYQKEVIPFGQAFLPLMTKRKSFEHEHELRALIWTVANGKNEMPFNDPMVNKYRDVPGLHVDVNLETLIKRVYISPTAPAWLTELVASTLRRYELKKDVVQSQLAASPLH